MRIIGFRFSGMPVPYKSEGRFPPLRISGFLTPEWWCKKARNTQVPWFAQKLETFSALILLPSCWPMQGCPLNLQVRAIQKLLPIHGETRFPIPALRPLQRYQMRLSLCRLSRQKNGLRASITMFQPYSVKNAKGHLQTNNTRKKHGDSPTREPSDFLANDFFTKSFYAFL